MTTSSSQKYNAQLLKSNSQTIVLPSKDSDYNIDRVFYRVFHPVFYYSYLSNANLQSNIFSTPTKDDYKLDHFSSYWYLEKSNELNNIKTSLEHWNNDYSPPNDYSFEYTYKILSILRELDFKPNRIMPSADEGIAICFINGNKYADIEVFNDKTLYAIKASWDFPDDSEVWQVYEDCNSLRNAVNIIRKYMEDD